MHCSTLQQVLQCSTPPEAVDTPSPQAPKPSPGPHKQRECLPLLLVLRNRLK